MIWDIRRAFLFLYRCLFRRRLVTGHPFSQVTDEDVARIVRRDFPEDQFDAAMSMLDEYGTEKWVERRGQDGKKRLERRAWCGRVSRTLQRGSRVRELAVREQQLIIDRDWKQYEEWLRR